MFRTEFYRLNARPCRWRAAGPLVVALVGGPRHPSRPYARLGVVDNVAVTVRARGNSDWTFQCQCDFFKAQEHLAEHYKVVLANLDATEGSNVRILNFNRNLLIAKLEEVFGKDAQRYFYEVCGQILRGYYAYGLSKEEIQEHVKRVLEPVVSKNR